MTTTPRADVKPISDEELALLADTQGFTRKQWDALRERLRLAEAAMGQLCKCAGWDGWGRMIEIEKAYRAATKPGGGT